MSCALAIAVEGSLSLDCRCEDAVEVVGACAGDVVIGEDVLRLADVDQERARRAAREREGSELGDDSAELRDDVSLRPVDVRVVVLLVGSIRHPGALQGAAHDSACSTSRIASVWLWSRSTSDLERRGSFLSATS